MKNKTRLISSLLLSLFLMPQKSTIYLQPYNEKFINSNFKINKKIIDVVEVHISEIMEKNLNIEIKEVKQLLDFNNNKYTLFELAPIGYIIYHNDSGTFYEYSSSSLSPYYGYNENLYYGNFKSYYQKVNSSYFHTLYKSKKLDNAELNNLKYTTSITHLNNMQNNNEQVLAYISNKTSLNNVKEEFKRDQLVTLANDQPVISMESFFKPLKERYQIGYTQIGNVGVCGYIAANLVLAYNAFAYERGLVPDKYLNTYSKCLNGNTLTNSLLKHAGINVNGDGKDVGGSTAFSMGEIVRKFIGEESNISKNWKVTTWLGSINAKGAIKKNQPPALFGSFNDPTQNTLVPIGDKGFHTVVAYGYSNYAYRVHYGWSNYSDVNLSFNAIGSTMILSYF